MRVLIFVIMLIFIGCDEKKVPVVIGLDSDYSSIARGVKNGMLLAEDEENIEFDFIDNKGDKFITKDIDKKLISQHNPLVIGHITSGVTKSVVPLFNNSNTILFSPTVSTKELSNLDDNFIRIQPTKNYQSIEPILKYISNFKEYSKMNIIYDTSNRAYADSLIKALQDKRNKYIKIDKIIPIDEENLDISKVDKNIPIFIIGSSHLSANIVVSLKREGFKSLIVVSGSAFTQDFIKNAGKYGEGVLFFSTFNPSSDNKKYIKFVSKFIEKFGYNPGSFEVKGYEIAKITAKVIDKNNIKKALINHTFDGLQGKIYINKYGDTFRETHIFILNNSIFEKVQ